LGTWIYQTPYEKLEEVTELLSQYKPARLKSSNPTRLPGLVSESVLLWDKVKIHMHRMKHGKLRISSLNP